MQGSSGTSQGDRSENGDGPEHDALSDDTAGMLKGLVADGVITSYELTGGGDAASLTVCAPPGGDALETEASVKAAIHQRWRVTVAPTGGS